LDADGTPDNLIKEGLKQPVCIKISFKKGDKEITGHVVPNQAQFSTEYFLVYMLPDFKSKMLTRLLSEQKDNSPLQFNLMGQHFQDVGLTKWSSFIAKQCSDNANHTKANFDKWDYLKAVARFPNVGNQLIPWVCTAKKPADAQVHVVSSTASQLSWGWLPLLNNGSEKSGQIFFVQPKTHQFKFKDLNKMVPNDPLKRIIFFKHCQATNKAAGVLEKIAKDKKQQKERKMAHLPAAHSHESSYHQLCHHKYCDYHQSNRNDCNNCQPDYRHWDHQCHNCPCCDNKDSKNSKSYKKKMIASAIISRKRDKAMHNDQSSLSSAGNLSKKRSHSLKISFALSFSVSLLPKQQELQQSPCGSG
jgi:hypothetical protein